MRITIAQKFLPFSHDPGVMCLLPKTTLRLHIFPGLLKIENLITSPPTFIKEIPIPVKGPIKGFTVLQNLEKEKVEVWGHAKSGYFRYTVLPIGSSSFTLQVEKGDFQFYSQPEVIATYNPTQERLALGVSKKLDWQLVKRRCDMAEVLPLWLFLGQKTPMVKANASGTGFFLKECETALQANRTECAIESLQHAFIAGFEGILSPCLNDTLHLGFDLPSLSDKEDSSPLPLLSQGALLIRNLFFQQKESKISILPHLPHQLHAGRYIHVKCNELGWLDMEWRSRKLRRLVFYSQVNHTIQLHFPKKISSSRLRNQENEPGKCFYNGDSVDIAVGDRLLFDRFE